MAAVKKLEEIAEVGVVVAGGVGHRVGSTGPLRAPRPLRILRRILRPSPGLYAFGC